MNHPAYQALVNFGKKYPNAKAIFGEMQKHNMLKDKVKGVFFSSNAIGQIDPQLKMMGENGWLTTENMENDLYSRDLTCGYLWGLHLFGAWRNTLGIYKIDGNIFSDAMSSPIPNDTPSTVFEQLPEWSVYIEFPQNAELNITYTDYYDNGDKKHRALGFWATYDYSYIGDKKVKTLNLTMHHEGVIRGVDGYYIPLRLEIKEGLTIKESLIQVIAGQLEAYHDPITSRLYAERDSQIGISLLSMLLFLCVQEPDVSRIKGEPVSREWLKSPKYSIHKKTGKFVPPPQPFIYQVGQRLGGEVREMQNKLRTVESEGRTYKKVKPHIRRGHWNGVWCGTGQNKYYKPYWQSAVFVNGR